MALKVATVFNNEIDLVDRFTPCKSSLRRKINAANHPNQHPITQRSLRHYPAGGGHCFRKRRSDRLGQCLCPGGNRGHYDTILYDRPSFS